MSRQAQIKSAEHALREGEERFRTLMRLSSDWYWEQDEEFRFTRLEGQARTRGGSGSDDRFLGQRRWETNLQIDGGRESHRALGDLSPWCRSEMLAVEVRNFGARQWIRWRMLQSVPPDASELETALFHAFRVEVRLAPQPLSVHRLHDVFQSRHHRQSLPAGRAAS